MHSLLVKVLTAQYTGKMKDISLWKEFIPYCFSFASLKESWWNVSWILYYDQMSIVTPIKISIGNHDVTLRKVWSCVLLLVIRCLEVNYVFLRFRFILCFNKGNCKVIEFHHSSAFWNASTSFSSKIKEQESLSLGI